MVKRNKYLIMSKYIVCKSGVINAKIGDEIKLNSMVEIYLFDKFYVSTLVNQALLDELLRKGVIKEENDDYKEIYNKAIKKLANQLNLSDNQVVAFLNILKKTNKWAVLQIVLKKIAIVLDSKYEDPINNCECVYAISPQDGCIHKIYKFMCYSYDNFPAFRTFKDAEIATKVVSKQLKDCFNAK